ncbi:MAG: hypothetical protein NZ108_03135, partial [Bacteroidia bacterium]|nr:hypothetical protein [Bacteroidia bacterium]
RLLLFLLLLITFVKSSAQSSNWYSSKPKFIFYLDNRNSFIRGKEADIVGFRFGVEIEHWRTGIGFYGLSTKHFKKITVLSAAGEPELLAARLRFVYVTSFGEYIFFRNRRWEFSAPVSLGLGKVSLETEKDGKIETIRENGIILIEPSITGHFKVFSWIGIGAGLGYRQVLLAPSNQYGLFSSPIYILKIKLFFSPIYKAIFKGEKTWQ